MFTRPRAAGGDNALEGRATLALRDMGSDPVDVHTARVPAGRRVQRVGGCHDATVARSSTLTPPHLLADRRNACTIDVVRMGGRA